MGHQKGDRMNQETLTSISYNSSLDNLSKGLIVYIGGGEEYNKVVRIDESLGRLIQIYVEDGRRFLMDNYYPDEVKFFTDSTPNTHQK